MECTPERQRGASLSEMKKISAGTIDRFASGLARQLHDLAGYPEAAEDEFDFVFWTRKMDRAFPERELMAIDGWRMIVDNLGMQLSEDRPPDFGHVCDQALYCRFEIGRWGKEPFPAIPQNQDQLVPELNKGFDRVLAMPLKHMALPLACLWTNAALCHNGFRPFAIAAKTREALKKSGGKIPNAAAFLINENIRVEKEMERIEIPPMYC